MAFRGSFSSAAKNCSEPKCNSVHPAKMFPWEETQELFSVSLSNTTSLECRQIHSKKSAVWRKGVFPNEAGTVQPKRQRLSELFKIQTSSTSNRRSFFFDCLELEVWFFSTRARVKMEPWAKDKRRNGPCSTCLANFTQSQIPHIFQTLRCMHFSCRKKMPPFRVKTPAVRTTSK